MSKPNILLPKRVLPGEKIGIVSISYDPDKGRIARGIRSLKRAGFEVVLDEDIHAPPLFIRSQDQLRAERLMRMWADPTIRAVIISTGGYGAIRILPYLDPAVFLADPKPLVGYSDITGLHMWLNRHGLLTFHGPTVDDIVPSRKVKTSRSIITAITTPFVTEKLGNGIAKSMVRGEATGRLVGGNLSLFRQCIGTDFHVDTTDAILFFEELDDPDSCVDGCLIHLRDAGMLQCLKGIVVGHMTIDHETEKGQFLDFIGDTLMPLGIPVLTDFPVGHAEPNLTLPMGALMNLVVGDRTGYLQYAEPTLC